MNWFGYMAVVTTFMSSVAAHAIYRPDWERPILRAELTEFDNDGHELNQGRELTLTMNKRDGKRNPTSFTFVEEQRIYCVMAPCPQPRHTVQFNITNRFKDSCGSTHYNAVEKRHINALPNLPLRRMEVVDHSTRLCEDYRKYGWDVELNLPLGAMLPAFKTRTFGGNPEPVYTIQ